HRRPAVVVRCPRSRRDRSAESICLGPFGQDGVSSREPMTDRRGSGSVPGASIRARDWGWRPAGRRKPAVSALDLDIEPGERVLLLGASGAGKSTLMQAMAGVLGGDEEGDESGTLLLDGRRPADARGRAGLVLQDPDSQIVLARIGDDVAF